MNATATTYLFVFLLSFLQTMLAYLRLAFCRTDCLLRLVVTQVPLRSKKIAIPNGVKLSCISWSTTEVGKHGEHLPILLASNILSAKGWLACGGENGLLKVLLVANSQVLHLEMSRIRSSQACLCPERRGWEQSFHEPDTGRS